MANPDSIKLNLKTLFVRNLPFSTTDSKLENVFSEIGPLKQCFVVKESGTDKCRGFGYVTYSVREDAERAQSEIKALDGRKLHIAFANKKLKTKGKKNSKNTEQLDSTVVTPADRSQQEKPIQKQRIKEHKKDKTTSQKTLKKARLIVRNLSFKCKENDLMAAFSKFGEVTEVKIPTKPDGRMFGFGFVQFSAVPAANIALQKMNAKEILGRTVAVDWSIPKNKYQEATKIEGSKTKKSDKDMTTTDSDSDEGSVSTGSAASEESDAEMRDDSESDDNRDDNDVSDSEDDHVESSEGGNDSDTENDDDDEGFSDASSDLEKTSSKKITKLSTDVDEGKTLFIRNLSFKTEQDDLDDLFEDNFGELAYCRIVVDKETEHSKGMAFVKFVNKEDAESCLQKAQDTSVDAGIFLDNRQLNVSLAVSRDKATDMKKEKKTKEPKDKRNLYLAREGMIRPGTHAAEGLSKVDLDKRAKVEDIKRQKLKSPLIFVSPTRLCIRNIPATVGDKELKKIFIKSAADKKAIVTECRIMRDLKRVNSQGMCKSRGFAFVAYSEHQHALQALRNTNNNPEIFGDHKRPIVEFSLENRSALDAKQKRIDRRFTKQESFKKNTDGGKQDRTPQVKRRKIDSTNKRPFERTQVTTINNTNPASSGMQTTPKGPKGLPSHSGAKLRHKNRGGDKSEKIHKKSKQSMSMKQGVDTEQGKEKKRKKNRKKTREQTDDFDELVSTYKQKLIGALSEKNKKGPATMKSKWFS